MFLLPSQGLIMLQSEVEVANFAIVLVALADALFTIDRMVQQIFLVAKITNVYHFEEFF